jgi:hypothetical protein
MRAALTTAEGKPAPCPHNRATVLLRGDPIFVGQQLWKGYPDSLPDALHEVLERHFEDDLKRGQRSKWLGSPPVVINGEPLD